MAPPRPSSRQAFEAWAASVTWGYDSEGYPLGLNTETLADHARKLGCDWRTLNRREDAGDYWSDDTHLAWLAWQAASDWNTPGALPPPG